MRQALTRGEPQRAQSCAQGFVDIDYQDCQALLNLDPRTIATETWSDRSSSLPLHAQGSEQRAEFLLQRKRNVEKENNIIYI